MRVRIYAKMLLRILNFAESEKFVSCYPDKHHHTRTLKREKTEITNSLCCMERERERGRERGERGERGERYRGERGREEMERREGER